MARKHRVDETPVPVLLRAAEVAELLGRSEYTLNYWRQNGDGPAYFRSRGKVFYDRQDVLDWLAEERRSGAPAR